MLSIAHPASLRNASLPHLARLPCELHQEILSHLDAETFLAARRASSDWYRASQTRILLKPLVALPGKPVDENTSVADMQAALARRSRAVANLSRGFFNLHSINKPEIARCRYSISADGDTLAFIRDANTIHFDCLQSSSRPSAHSLVFSDLHGLRGISISNGAKVVAFVDDSWRAHVLDTRLNPQLRRYQTPSSERCGQVHLSGPGDVCAISAAQVGLRIVWLDRGSQRTQILASPQITTMAFCSTGKKLAAATASGSIQLFSIAATAQKLACIEPFSTAITFCALSPDGNWLAVGAGHTGSSLYALDQTAGERGRHFKRIASNAVGTFTADSQSYISACGDDNVVESHVLSDARLAPVALQDPYDMLISGDYDTVLFAQFLSGQPYLSLHFCSDNTRMRVVTDTHVHTWDFDPKPQPSIWTQLMENSSWRRVCALWQNISQHHRIFGKAKQS